MSLSLWNTPTVGIHASRSANRFEALEPVRQGVHRCFGAIGPGVARGLKLRHDHGSNYMSGDFQDEIECLGIEASPSFSPKATASQSALLSSQIQVRPRNPEPMSATAK
jgi:hypothetical protein